MWPPSHVAVCEFNVTMTLEVIKYNEGRLIGTYQLAIAAKHHRVPFYIAAPVTTIDFGLKSGEEITIEERPSREMLCIGGQRVAAEGIGCWNPAFDVTPAQLITGGIITERGVFEVNNLKALCKLVSNT